ncbi:MAG: bifunctional glycosyltransferase family 2/GtrA family protein [Lachnospiraceae bacterium]|nr:bifunctional glycosyltransferase family 2/GtrA family protein [Lachnospiraceae bacterium]
MTAKTNHIALIPAYEPEPLLIGLVEKLAEKGFSIVVVDDGSGPDYRTVFESIAPFARVLTHPVNQGKGRALKTAFNYILQAYDDPSIVVTVDADGQHSVKDALMLCETAEKHPDSLVLGSRKMKGRIPLRSRFGNASTRLVYRLTTGLRVYDTQTGLRAFSLELIPRMLEIPGARYEYEMNVLLAFAKNHVPILEEEIETIYLDNNSASHFDAVRDSCRIYKEILKFSASSLAGFAVDYSLYSLLLFSGASLAAANVFARAVSASVNYTLNRKFVFRSKAGVARSAASYFLLAAGILAGNTCLLSLLVNTLGVHQLAAKLLTEIAFFIFSWFIQKFFVFRRKETYETCSAFPNPAHTADQLA